MDFKADWFNERNEVLEAQVEVLGDTLVNLGHEHDKLIAENERLKVIIIDACKPRAIETCPRCFKEY